MQLCLAQEGAFAENPDQLALLQRRPELPASAVELRGHAIREGDRLVLFYASANRDEDVFDDPFRFRIDRQPNHHLGFGIGEHFCLGAHLARRSHRALFAELARSLEAVELAGEPRWIRSSFVVGLKHLPIRYRLRAEA